MWEGLATLSSQMSPGPGTKTTKKGNDHSRPTLPRLGANPRGRNPQCNHPRNRLLTELPGPLVYLGDLQLPSIHQSFSHTSGLWNRLGIALLYLYAVSRRQESGTQVFLENFGPLRDLRRHRSELRSLRAECTENPARIHGVVPKLAHRSGRLRLQVS